MKAAALLLLGVFVGQEGVELRGVVVNAATKQPITGTTVLLIRPEAIGAAVAVSTDDRGRFAFPNVIPAAYRLVAEHDDYLRGLSNEIAIEAGRAPATVSLALTPTAVISGRVTDEFGQPISKVYVRALTTRVVAEVRTNDLGEYRLFGLAPGVYVISAERYQGPTIQNSHLMTPTPPCPDCPGEGIESIGLAGLLVAGRFIDPRALTGQTYPAVFYSGTTDRAAATPVQAGPGARLDGIDLKLIVK